MNNKARFQTKAGLVVSNSTANIYRFGGQWGYQRDEATRLYVRARHLDTARSRWISRDPIGFRGGDWNLYRYVGNNPVSRVDSSGLGGGGLNLGGNTEVGWNHPHVLPGTSLTIPRINFSCTVSGGAGLLFCRPGAPWWKPEIVGTLTFGGQFTVGSSPIWTSTGGEAWGATGAYVGVGPNVWWTNAVQASDLRGVSGTKGIDIILGYSESDSKGGPAYVCTLGHAGLLAGVYDYETDTRAAGWHLR